MSDRLPLLISVPHSGLEIPHEIKDVIQISNKEIFDESDAFTDQIFDLEKNVEGFGKASIARVFVDLNRARSDSAPENPDGSVKSRTTHGVSIYKSSQVLTPDLIERLLSRYHDPYHQNLTDLIRTKKLKFAFDCHSMDTIGPVYGMGAGKKRPHFVLSNRGDRSGEATPIYGTPTCSGQAIRTFSKCLQEVFGVKAKEVSINEPFQGGNVLRTHASVDLPWIQFEINKELYLKQGNSEAEYHEPSTEVIKELRDKIHNSMAMFLNRI